MVGMSGKSSEPRRGPSHGKKQSTSHPASKPQVKLSVVKQLVLCYLTPDPSSGHAAIDGSTADGPYARRH